MVIIKRLPILGGPFEKKAVSQLVLIEIVCFTMIKCKRKEKTIKSFWILLLNR